MLKNFLTENDILYHEVNVESNPEQMERVIKQTGQLGVPQVEINGKWIVGFDPYSILYELKKRN